MLVVQLKVSDPAHELLLSLPAQLLLLGEGVSLGSERGQLRLQVVHHVGPGREGRRLLLQ